MRYRLFKRAYQQLIDIWIYTDQEWGEKQSDKYIEGLYTACKSVFADSISWTKVRGKRFAGVYFFRYKKHIVFFKKLTTGDIGIISILHENMDLPDRLLSDIDESESV